MAFRNRFAALALILLTFALLAISLVAGTEGAAAARYAVAQCGWHVGHDATWLDYGDGKYSGSTYCQPPESANALDGVQMISQVKSSAKTVGGTRFASWRWQAPAGTGIVSVHGQRWHYLRAGFQHRIGATPANGSFDPFLILESSDSVKREVWKSFSPFVRSFESRLTCRRPADRTCDSNGTVLAGLRALTITLDDPAAPSSQISGPLTGAGWLRGPQSLTFSNKDVGSGVRFSQTSIGGTIRASTETSCTKKMIGGQWRGTKMQPCPATATGSQTVDTRNLPDGPHALRHCALDFAATSGCTADRTIRVDNNPPAAPRALAVDGGEGWHRGNGFNLIWTDPAQGVASPIASSRFRLTGSGDYAGGPWSRTDPGRISDIRVPGPGEYRVRVWLVDQAGNTDETHSAEATLRLDDVPPTGYFVEPPAEDPLSIRVPVADRYSGVAGGNIFWRPATGQDWHEIPTRYSTAGEPALTARFPSEMPRGSWVLRAAIADRAGNLTVTDRRANGSQMTVKTPLRDETTLTAGFTAKVRDGRAAIEVGYRRGAHIGGRLTGTESGGVGDAEVTVTEEYFPGSRRGTGTRSVRTDSRGYYSLWLAPGPGRRIKVGFAGTKRLEGSSSGALEMRVQGRLSFKAKPKRLKTGQRVRFRGRIKNAGAWQPARGNLVQIQYFEESARRWRPVVITRTDRRGRYRSGYRFRYITGAARIRLRALLVPSSRFPYSGAASKPVVVRVRG